MSEFSAEGLSGLHPTKSMLLKDIWKRGRTAPPVEPEKELACLLFSPGPLWSDNWGSKWGLFIQILSYLFKSIKKGSYRKDTLESFCQGLRFMALCPTEGHVPKII